MGLPYISDSYCIEGIRLKQSFAKFDCFRRPYPTVPVLWRLCMLSISSSA